MPETASDAELLAAAAVALNRHADILRGLGAVVADAGRELYLVGGSVRDAIMGRLGADLDFATDSPPEEMQRILTGWAEALWDTGIAFGTVGAAKDAHRLEITTYRSDIYDQMSRNPEVRFGTSLEGDLARRDFTANAMAVRIDADGPAEFVDPLGGLAAIRQQMLDTPAAPEVSFGDDPLRMLRAARFVSQLGFSVAPRVRTAIEEMAPQLGRITVERVAAELDKMMLGDDPVAGVELMVEHRHGRCGAAGDRGDAADHRRAPPAQGRLPAFTDGAGAGHRVRGPTLRAAPTWCCGGPRCCTTSASPPPVDTKPTGE